MKPESILFFAKHLNLSTTLFKNKLKFPSIPFHINSTKIQEHISYMKIVICNIVKTGLKITETSSFIHTFKEDLSSYRGQLTGLVKFISINSLIQREN